MSCDNCEQSKNFSLVLCQKNSDKGENFIYILPFCLTAELPTLSESSPPHCCIRLEENSMWCFWSPPNKNRDKKCRWKSCHQFSADKQKTTLGQCRILSFTCSTSSDKTFLSDLSYTLTKTLILFRNWLIFIFFKHLFFSFSSERSLIMQLYSGQTFSSFGPIFVLLQYSFWLCYMSGFKANNEELL